MKDARSWIARLGMAGLCLMGAGCGGGGLPDPSSDPSLAQEAPPPIVATAAPSAPPAAPAPVAAPAEPAPQLARNDPAPAAAPAAVEPAAPAAVEPAAPASAPVAAAPAEAAAPAGEEKPAATKGDASGTSELLNLSNNATTAPPPAETPAEMPKEGTPPGSAAMPGLGSIPGPGGSGRNPGEGMAAMPGLQPGGSGGFGGDSGMDGNDANSNAPANYRMPITGAMSFLNAVKSKNKDRIADATALHAPKEAHNVAMQKLFSQIVDLSVSDSQVDDLAKALQGYRITGLDTATSSGRQKVVLGKTNGQNGQFRRTLTMRHEAKGWKVADISGQSEIQGFRGLPMRPGRRR